MSFKKQVQRKHALLQTALHFSKGRTFDDSRYRIKWEKPLVKFAVFVDTELHAVATQLPVDLVDMSDQFLHDLHLRQQ